MLPPIGVVDGPRERGVVGLRRVRVLLDYGVVEKVRALAILVRCRVLSEFGKKVRINLECLWQKAFSSNDLDFLSDFKHLEILDLIFFNRFNMLIFATTKIILSSNFMI
jgi:hypothetical protein